MTDPTTYITDPTALASVKELAAGVAAARAGAIAARDAHQEVSSRRTELRQVLSDHNSVEPAPEPDVTAELGALLASNPSAATSADWTGKLRESQDATAAAVKAWQGKRTIIDQAIARLDTEVADRAEDFEAAKVLHERAWAAFVNAARVAMTAELELQFADFYAKVLGPLDALNVARKLYGNELVYSGPRRQLSENSLLIIGTPPISFGNTSDGVQLYPSNDMQARASLFDAFINSFSDPAPSPAPRSRTSRG